MLASVPDLLRLIAVPVFAWVAYRDVRTRRVPNWVWLPLVVIGMVALAIEGWSILTTPGPSSLFVIRSVVSLAVGFLGYVFWRYGGFGGADAKAIMALALLFPGYPVLYLPWSALPLSRSPLGVFSLTILTNTVLLGMVVPLVLAGRNAVNGRVTATMFIGRPVAVDRIPGVYGRLLGPDRGFTSNSHAGLDIDALRMYLCWRGTTLAAVRNAPSIHRDPATIPIPPNDPGDGSLTESGGVSPALDSASKAERHPPDASPPDPRHEFDDPWAAAAFLAGIDGDAYGTTPEQLRGGLERLCSDNTVWITPGIPFLLPVFLGLITALTYGDILSVILRAIGIG